MADQTPIPGDEFAPYLAEQLKDPEVRAAYEVEADQTPIPADNPTEAAIAAVVKALGRFEQPPYGDLQCSAARAAIVAVDAAAPILLAAGRTAAAADPLAEKVANAAVAWRTALVTPGVDVGAAESVLFHLAAQYEDVAAARIAENGADR